VAEKESGIALLKQKIEALELENE
jgi:hypothetical protein